MTDATTTNVLLALPDGSTVSYRNLTRSVAQRIRLLAPYRGRSDPVRCLCRPQGILLGVAHRAVPTDTFYLYPLRRGDWQLHALECPLRRPPILGAPRPARPTVETLADGLVLNLSLPRYRLLDTPEWEPQPKSRGELVTLLRVLREASGLNLGDPAWHRGSLYADTRRRLLDAADRIHLRGVQRLADWLYIPPRFQPAQNEEIGTAFEEFLARLEPRERRAPYGFFLGALAEIREGRGGGKAIRLAHTYRLLWLSDALWRNRFGPGKGLSTLDPQPRPLLLAQASRKTQHGWLMVRDAVLLSTPDG